MKIIKPSYNIEDKINGNEILQKIERAGRTCYKSEKEITAYSAKKFVRMLIETKHESVLEHEKISVRIICDRGLSHEIVRHRIASYSQESTRYCNYSKKKFGNEIVIIEPVFWKSKSPEDAEKYSLWKKSMEVSEKLYMRLVELGATPQEARSVLPNSLKTELVMTMRVSCARR